MKGFTLFELLGAILFVVFFGTVIYVAVHFISKWW